MFILFLQCCQTKSSLHGVHASGYQFLPSFMATQQRQSAYSGVAASLTGSLKESFSFLSVRDTVVITGGVFWILHEPPTEKGNILEGYIIQGANWRVLPAL